jgi:hypothetical protein
MMFATAALLAGAAVAPARASAQAFEYAVKVVCGSPDFVQLAPGRYFTTVNVHSPDSTEFRFKVATTRRLDPGLVTPFRSVRLRPDQAVEIDCRMVQSMTNAGFVEGFVVIQSRVELDVVAAYTAGASGGNVTTMDIERVQPRRLQ